MARLTISYIVRRFCLDCQGNSSKAVRECADEDCALWEHRLPPQGTDPHATLLPSEHFLNGSASEAKQPTASAGNNGLSAEHDYGHRGEIGKHAPNTASSAPDSTGIGGRPDAKAREAARRVILRAVRRHCITCAACRADVRTCAARECGLWSYRFGVNPETYRAVRQRFSRPKTLSLF